MSIIKSQDIEGDLTHLAPKEYKDSVLNGKSKAVHSGLDIKPSGIWISWNGGWEIWCKSNMPHWLTHEVCLKAKLKPNLRLWHIDDLDDFLEIWKQYSTSSMDVAGGILFMTEDKGKFWEWLRNKKKIDGVALTDKGQWKTRMTTWLYGWDCESIVIFDPKNVKLTEK